MPIGERLLTGSIEASFNRANSDKVRGALNKYIKVVLRNPKASSVIDCKPSGSLDYFTIVLQDVFNSKLFFPST